MNKIIRFWPVLLLLGLIAVFFFGLQQDPRKLPSNLIGKPVPAFRLPELHQAGQYVRPEQFKGQVWLLNVWASWCVACRHEHDLLKAVAASKSITLVGLNYKDHNSAAAQWLKDMGGDPYQAIAVDSQGTTGIDLGIYGVPETFIIDKQGRIAYRYTGAITNEDYQNVLIPVIEKLKNE